MWRRKIWNKTYLSNQAVSGHDQIIKKKTQISWERKELLSWNKKHFSSFLKGYQLPKTVRPESAPFTLSKIEISAQMFLMNYAKFLITPFLKNPSDDCFYINTRSETVPPPPFTFSKTMSHLFSGWVPSRLNLKTGNKSELNMSKPLAKNLFSTYSNICDGAFLRK